MTKIKKAVLVNLYGETRQQEKRRIIRERSKAIASGISVEKYRELPFSIGTTRYMKRMRARSLRKVGLPLTKPKITDIYR